MPLLQVRDMPDSLYRTLSRVAEQDHRSIAQETIVLLQRALNQEESRISRRRRILSEILDDRIENADSLPDPADLIREDRDR